MTINTTPARGYPWPDNTEAVANGWDAIRDLAVAVDADMDPRPMGLLAYVETQGPHGMAGGTEADIPNLITPAVVLPAGRVVEVVAHVNLIHMTAAGWDHLYVHQAVNAGAMAGLIETQQSNASGAAYWMQARRIVSPAAGSYVWKARWLSETGSANIGIAGRLLHSHLAVVDLGAA